MLRTEDLPLLNAILNGAATVCLLAGRWAIARKRITQHRAWMLAAMVLSTAFLGSYLVYHFSTHIVTPFAGTGIWRPIYYSILTSHIVLAPAVPVLAVLAVWRGLRMQVARHRAIVRWAFPIWLYVSVTGVLIYLMLYHWFAPAQ